MGNCIGKKSDTHYKQRKYPSATSRPTKPTSSCILASPSSLKRHSIFLSHLSDIKETDDNDKIEKNVIQYSSPSFLATTTTTLPSLTNDPIVSIHTSTPVQLSSECKKLKSSNTVKVFSENHIKTTIYIDDKRTRYNDGTPV